MRPRQGGPASGGALPAAGARTMLAITLATLVGVAPLLMAAPTAGALDDPLAGDDPTASTDLPGPTEPLPDPTEPLPEPTEPLPEPTPLPEPVDEAVEGLKQTIADAVDTVDGIVNPKDPEPDPDDPEPDPDDPPDPDEPHDPAGGGPSAPGGGSKPADLPPGTAATPVLPSGSTVGDVVAGVEQILADTTAEVGAIAGAADLDNWFDDLPWWWWLPFPTQPTATTMAGGPWLTSAYTHPLGPRNTGDIIATLAALGMAPQELARTLAPFPVAGQASYSDDFGAPRHEDRTHQGTDVFAARGTPVIAATDGVVSHLRTGTLLGGTSLRVTDPNDGTYYYYAHLDRFEPGLRDGQPVAKGDVVGYVGNTGNAVLTPPHLHFQIHPGGGAPVNPVPYLDRWLADARQTVTALQAAATTAAPLAAPPLDLAAAQAPRPLVGELPRVLAGMAAEVPNHGLGVGFLVAAGIAVLLALLHAAPTLTDPQRPT